MHDTLNIKPKAGLDVLDPVSFAPLAADGEAKPRNTYWLRRLRDGDVEETSPAVPAAVAPERQTRNGSKEK